MNGQGQQVLYEAKLKQHRKGFVRVSLLLLGLYTAFVLALLLTVGIGQISGPLIGAGVVLAAILSVPLTLAFRWRGNRGFYRISADNYGLYVHSDDAVLPSFSIPATDLQCLIQRTRETADSTDTFYFVQTKSGKRHRVEDIFGDLDHMKLFERIADRFHWVEIIEELENCEGEVTRK